MSNPEQWDQCSEQTRKVLTLAHQEAQRLQQERVGTEHLLLGLLLGGEGRIMQVLHSLAIDPQKLRRDVEFVIGHGDRAAMEEIKLTRLASKVLEQALKEAHRLKQQLIGPEHVLLGLVGVQECIPAGLLESRGATLEIVREATRAALNGRRYSPRSAQAAPGTPVPESVRPQTAVGYRGNWVNDDPQTNDISRLIITSEGSTLTVHAYGACSPDDCDWGTVSAPLEEEPFRITFVFDGSRSDVGSVVHEPIQLTITFATSDTTSLKVVSQSVGTSTNFFHRA